MVFGVFLCSVFVLNSFLTHCYIQPSVPYSPDHVMFLEHVTSCQCSSVSLCPCRVCFHQYSFSLFIFSPLFLFFFISFFLFVYFFFFSDCSKSHSFCPCFIRASTSRDPVSVATNTPGATGKPTSPVYIITTPRNRHTWSKWWNIDLGTQ